LEALNLCTRAMSKLRQVQSVEREPNLNYVAPTLPPMTQVGLFWEVAFAANQSADTDKYI